MARDRLYQDSEVGSSLPFSDIMSGYNDLIARNRAAIRSVPAGAMVLDARDAVLPYSPFAGLAAVGRGASKALGAVADVAPMLDPNPVGPINLVGRAAGVAAKGADLYSKGAEAAQEMHAGLTDPADPLNWLELGPALGMLDPATLKAMRAALADKRGFLQLPPYFHHGSAAKWEPSEEFPFGKFEETLRGTGHGGAVMGRGLNTSSDPRVADLYAGVAATNNPVSVRNGKLVTPKQRIYTFDTEGLADPNNVYYEGEYAPPDALDALTDLEKRYSLQPGSFTNVAGNSNDLSAMRLIENFFVGNGQLPKPLLDETLADAGLEGLIYPSGGMGANRMMDIKTMMAQGFTPEAIAKIRAQAKAPDMTGIWYGNKRPLAPIGVYDLDMGTGQGLSADFVDENWLPKTR